MPAMMLVIRREHRGDAADIDRITVRSNDAGDDPHPGPNGMPPAMMAMTRVDQRPSTLMLPE